jgi:perosamine synthetase
MNEMHKQLAAISGQGSTMNGERRTVNGERSIIPYGRQYIDENDIQAVVEVLRSDWLTTGPKIAEFEEAVAQFVGTQEAVAVNSGTAALHSAMYAAGIGPGDEVILPPMTFAATANSVVFQRGTPVFADVNLDTLLIDPNKVEAKITPQTKAIVAVDYAGQPCDYDSLQALADKHGLILIADACHALGAEYRGKRVGTLADLTVFSFHPVKHITTGEGGMITTDKPDLADRMRLFRNHGIIRNPEKFVSRSPFTAIEYPKSEIRNPKSNSSWYYEMQDLGYNYRMTDFQCALGISQLHKLPGFLKRRREIAAFYHEALADIPGIEPLGLRSDVMPAKQSAMRHVYPARPVGGDHHTGVESLPNGTQSPFHRGEGHSTGAPSSMPSSSDAMRHAPCSMPSTHAYHLYVVKIDFSSLGIDRMRLFEAMREKGIGVNVHYIPVHLHPFFRERFGYQNGECPVAEDAYKQIISLPIFSAMTDKDISYVARTVCEVVSVY